MTLFPPSASDPHSPPSLDRDSLIVNPMTVARIVVSGSRLIAVEICFFAPHQGLKRLMFTAASGSLCATIAGLLQDPASLARAPATVVMLLIQARILIERSPQTERSPCGPAVITEDGSGAASDTPSALAHHVAPDEWQQILDGLGALPRAIDGDAVAQFNHQRYVVIERLASFRLAAAMAAFYRRLETLGVLTVGDPLSRDRLSIYGDPAGRRVLRHFLSSMCALADREVRPSYTYATIYHGGAMLPMHRDRAQCEYTVSLLLDYAGLGEDDPTPWPLSLATGPGPHVVDLRPRVGGGVVFRGRQLPNGRPSLACDASCCVLMCHYVDAGFAGPLE